MRVRDCFNLRNSPICWERVTKASYFFRADSASVLDSEFNEESPLSIAWGCKASSRRPDFSLALDLIHLYLLAPR